MRAPADEGEESSQCEAFDWLQTPDDAVSVRCQEPGIRITETLPLGLGTRTRVVCVKHRCGWTPS